MPERFCLSFQRRRRRRRRFKDYAKIEIFVIGTDNVIRYIMLW